MDPVQILAVIIAAAVGVGAYFLLRGLPLLGDMHPFVRTDR